MMDGIRIRQGHRQDVPAMAEVADRAFGRPDEGRILAALEANGDIWMHVIVEQDGHAIGQCAFYFLPVKDRLGALGLGPMSVDPWIQKQGLGLSMARFGLATAERAGVPIVFVLGHPDYYPKLGFSMEAAKEFESPFSGQPSFMALRFRGGPPMSGKLVFPKAFGI